MRAAETGEKKNRERRRAFTFAPAEREMSAGSPIRRDDYSLSQYTYHTHTHTPPHRHIHISVIRLRRINT